MQTQTETQQATDRRLFLKIKLINLADEARTIRKMEKRNPKLRNELWCHRTGIVRSESRHTLLAYGFLRGRTLAQVGCGKTAPDWKKVEAMAIKYGPRKDGWYVTDKEKKAISEQFQAWKGA